MARQITDLNFGPPMRKLADAAIFRDKHAGAKPVGMHAAATELIFAAAAITAIFGDSRAARPRHSARSEERRVGNAWVSTSRPGGNPYPKKKKEKLMKHKP